MSLNEDKSVNDASKSVVINIDGIEPGLLKPASQIPKREDRVIPPAPPPAVRRTSAPRAPVRRDFYKEGLFEDELEAMRPADTREDADGGEEPVAVYENVNGAFERVEVYKWRARYRFYEKFESDAEKLIRKSCPECAFVPFYSALPQYTLMNMSQFRYYLWWRHNARHGVFLPSDTGYILLYIFEIINLPEVIPPKTGMAMLCSAFCAYHDKFAYLGKQMAEWICDYSLIHNVKIPIDRLRGSEYDMIKLLSLPDVLLQTDQLGAGIRAICIAAGTSYRAGQYYRDGNKEAFDLHIPASAVIGMQAVVEKMKSGFIRRTEIRDTYFGAVISSAKKRKVVIYRTDMPALEQVRGAAALVLKYAENRTRALCSIPSRYSVSKLPPEAKAAMDVYFAPFAEKKRTGDDCYDESLYEAPSKGINIENAKKIERDSWENAALFEDVYEEEPDGTSDSPPPEAESAHAPRFGGCVSVDGDGEEDVFKAFVDSLEEGYLSLLSALLTSKEEFRRECAERRLLPDAALERIDSAAAETVGDAVTEDGGISGFYRDDISRAVGAALKKEHGGK
ncbi:MAG: TerB N-terminal domain-containing protein [Clostridia bacterium]|nr:TerB N-terminal domain-containing protein [Clostridia bacterium]